MKLLRFITDEEHARITEISKRTDLVTDNVTNYFWAENMRDDSDVIYMNTLLEQIIDGFAFFSNFTKANLKSIRIQYRWNETFTGVGWITTDELRDGWAGEQ